MSVFAVLVRRCAGTIFGISGTPANANTYAGQVNTYAGLTCTYG